MPRHLALLGLAAAALAPPAAAQWDSVLLDPTQPIVTEGFHVLHAAPTGFHAFSASAQRWKKIAEPNAILRGTGDWTAVLEEATGFRAYSARHDDTAFLQIESAALVLVHDDVALVIDDSDPFQQIAWGYSAQTNEWRSIGLTSIVTLEELAISRFVAGVRDEATYWGFSARTGEWVANVAELVGGALVADGNVLLYDLANPNTGSTTRRVAAFSGVRGTWAESPQYALGTSVVWDHNVAAVRGAASGTSFVPAAYSAYSALWVSSPTTYPAGGTLTLEQNWVRAQRPQTTPRFEAFAALPGASWAGVDGDWTAVDDAEDFTLVRRADGAEMLAFSGLLGTWTPLALSGGESVVDEPDSHALVRGSLQLWHAYSPARGQWSTFDAGSPSSQLTGESISYAFAFFGELFAYSTRWNRWVAGPVSQSFTLESIASGSVIAVRESVGANTDLIHAFDERGEAWVSVDPGHDVAFEAGENVVLYYPDPSTAPAGERVGAFGVHAGVWTDAPASAVLPVSQNPEPEADENVAWFVDAAGRLFAFGSANEGHVWHQWPNCTETHVSGSGGSPPTTPSVGMSVRGAEIETVFVFASPGIVAPFVVPGVFGQMHLDLAGLIQLGLLGQIGPAGVLTVRYPLPNQLKTGAQAWIQPLLLDLFVTLTVRWGERADPVWFF